MATVNKKTNSKKNKLFGKEYVKDDEGNVKKSDKYTVEWTDTNFLEKKEYKQLVRDYNRSIQLGKGVGAFAWMDNQFTRGQFSDPAAFQKAIQEDFDKKQNHMSQNWTQVLPQKDAQRFFEEGITGKNLAAQDANLRRQLLNLKRTHSHLFDKDGNFKGRVVLRQTYDNGRIGQAIEFQNHSGTPITDQKGQELRFTNNTIVDDGSDDFDGENLHNDLFNEGFYRGIEEIPTDDKGNVIDDKNRTDDSVVDNQYQDINTENYQDQTPGETTKEEMDAYIKAEVDASKDADFLPSEDEKQQNLTNNNVITSTLNDENQNQDQIMDDLTDVQNGENQQVENQTLDVQKNINGEQTIDQNQSRENQFITDFSGPNPYDYDTDEYWDYQKGKKQMNMYGETDVQIPMRTDQTQITTPSSTVADTLPLQTEMNVMNQNQQNVMDQTTTPTGDDDAYIPQSQREYIPQSQRNVTDTTTSTKDDTTTTTKDTTTTDDTKGRKEYIPQSQRGKDKDPKETKQNNDKDKDKDKDKEKKDKSDKKARKGIRVKKMKKGGRMADTALRAEGGMSQGGQVGIAHLNKPKFNRDKRELDKLKREKMFSDLRNKKKKKKKKKNKKLENGGKIGITHMNPPKFDHDKMELERYKRKEMLDRVRKKDVASSERAEFMKSCKAGGSSGSTCRKIWRDMKKAKRQAKKGRKASYGMSMAESPRKAQGGMSLGKNVRSMIKGKPAK